MPGTPPTPEQTILRYRILFYAAVVVALAACGLAWQVHRQAESLGYLNTGKFAQERDRQYEFIIDNYGYKYKGHTGNLLDDLIVLFGLWEKDQLFFMRDYLKNSGIAEPVVVDVGANTGNHSLFLSRCSAHVHAFEPYPPIIRRFQENLALNPHVKNITLHEVGLGAQAAELPFTEPITGNDAIGSFRFEGNKVEGRTTHEKKLKVVAGDEWFQKEVPGNIALIKIDVEGFEEAVLSGLRQTLVKHRPLLVIELSPPPEGSIDSLAKLESLLPENYDFLTFTKSAKSHMNGQYVLSDYRPLAAGLFRSGTQADVVAYPRERAAAIPR